VIVLILIESSWMWFGVLLDPGALQRWECEWVCSATSSQLRCSAPSTN